MPNTVDKVIAVAEAEVGYLEKSAAAYKRNPKVLYSKTEGAGEDNYTKYGKEMHDIYPKVMDFPAYWCDAFVDWCFYKAYGIATAKSLIGGNFDDYTVASATMYKRKNALDIFPHVGDQVFFTKNGQVSGCYHTGIVVAVDSKTIHTIEGNTSKASAVVRNGGGVAKKQYILAQYKNKLLFGHPKYDVMGTPTFIEGKNYILTACMNVRNSPSTKEGDKNIIESLPTGTRVNCKGVIKDTDGVRTWLQIAPQRYICACNAKKLYVREV